MKKILKIGLSIVGILYLAVIIFVTGCLLFYNQYKVTQINDKTFIIIDDKSDMYKDGDLVIFTKNPNDEIVKGDEIFFYEITNGTVNVVSGTVTKSEKITDKETTFTINGNHNISSESVIGKIATASTYPNVGKFLYIFESRFGFLLLVILPALIFFFYEIYRLVSDIKAAKEETTGMEIEKTQGVSSNAPEATPLENVQSVSAESVSVEVSGQADAGSSSLGNQTLGATNEVSSVTSSIAGEENKQVASTSAPESLDLNDKKEQ